MDDMWIGPTTLLVGDLGYRFVGKVGKSVNHLKVVFQIHFRFHLTKHIPFKLI